jgi:subtilisin-like proprotein convertase family protein
VFAVTLSEASQVPVKVNYATAAGSANSNVSNLTPANSASITIPSSGAATPNPSNITVGAASGVVTRVTASIANYSHTWAGDVDILLQGPSGQTVVLMSDAGENAISVSGLNITFDDNAASSVPEVPTSGTFRPTNYTSFSEVYDLFLSPAPAGPYGNSLAAFNGVSPVGTWKLFVADDTSGDSGSIAGGWSLTISTSTGDFVATAGTLTFAPGVTRMTFAVPVRGDASVEGNETFTANLSLPVNATIADGVGLGTILDDDGASPPAGSGAADVLMDFGTSGLWGLYNGSTWNQIHWSDPSVIAAADIDGNKQSDVIAVFPGAGLWAKLNGVLWTQIHFMDPIAIAAADLDGNGQSDLILNFGAAGVWVFSNNSTFFQINTGNPAQILTSDLDGDGRPEVIMNFSPGGVYKWNYVNGLTPIHALTASVLAVGNIDGVGGDELFLGFPGFGLYYLAGGTTFKFFHTAIPSRMVVADIDNNGQADIVADFTGFGIYTNKNLTAWTLIHPMDVGMLVVADIDNSGKADVLMTFAGSGLWAWTNDVTWTFIHPTAPEGVAVGKLD